MPKLIVTWLCFILIIHFTNGQDLKGEWVQIKIPNTFGLNNNITKISGDSIYFYSFDMLKHKERIHFINTNTIAIKDTLVVEFALKGKNAMMVKKVNNEPENEMGFVRLLSTNDPNNQIEILKSAKLAMKLKYKTLNFSPGKKLNLQEILISDAALISADSVCIEKRKDSYFLNFYTIGHRTSMFPIKEVNRDGLTLYAVPSHYGEVYVKKIE